jgi:molybdate transport system permease protein
MDRTPPYTEGAEHPVGVVRAPRAVNQRRSATGVRPPLAAVLVAAAGVAVFFLLPLFGLIQRVPWTDFMDDLRDPAVRPALRLSLVCSLSATVLSVVIGVPIAWVLARTDFPGKSLVRALALLPLVLPPVVGGIALLAALGRRGVFGQYLDRWFDVQLPFTTAGAIIAETFVAMPFLIITVEGALRALDTRYEDAAATLGAGRWTVLGRVTLPMIGPSLAAGAVLTWARALGEFGATITFAGNLRGRTQTMPLAVYVTREASPGAALSLSVVLLAISIAVLALVGSRVIGSRTALRNP